MQVVQREIFHLITWTQSWNTGYKDKHDHRRYSEEEEKETSSVKTFQCNSSYEGSVVVSMCVVPVKIPHKQSNIALNTYALLGGCSQGKFVTEGVLMEMNLKEKDTTITVKTRDWEVTENSKVIARSKVSNSSDFGQRIVRLLRLPKSYTIKWSTNWSQFCQSNGIWSVYNKQRWYTFYVF